MDTTIPAVSILGSPIHSTTMRSATIRICQWAARGESRYVCLANTHMLMEARDSADFARVLALSDLNCADGMPLVWMQRALGVTYSERIRGADLMAALCAAAAQSEIPVGLYGGSVPVLERLVRTLADKFPRLNINYRHSPPFRLLRPDEDYEVLSSINTSRVRLLFVGLGCPKQEMWMARHRGRIRAVMIGVGAAFDMHAGNLPQAPNWMQALGLEWVHRLCQDPLRLSKRYLRNNPRFLALALRDLACRAAGDHAS